MISILFIHAWSDFSMTLIANDKVYTYVKLIMNNIIEMKRQIDYPALNLKSLQ